MDDASIISANRDDNTGERILKFRMPVARQHSSSNIIPVIKSRRMRRAGHVARRERGQLHTGFWWGNLMERERLEEPRVNGRLTSKWIFKGCDGEA